MVSTRHHPRPFPPPPEPTSPSSTSRSYPETPTSTTTSSKPTPDSPPPPSTTRSRSRKRKSTSKAEDETPKETSYQTSDLKSALTRSKTRPSRSQSRPSKRARKLYTHTPPPFLIPWLLFSLPLVIWDTLYILLRPHSMPGGRLHRPIWTPYELYGQIDHIYGWPAWDSQNGFTAAQACLNAIETTLYIHYLYIVSKRVISGDGFIRGVAARSWDVFARRDAGGKPKVVVRGGADVAGAVLLVFATFVLTCGKTVLYALNEHHSGYKHVRHNFDQPLRLIFLWILPNGPWIVVPASFAWVLGKEIVEAMTTDKGGRSNRGVTLGKEETGEEL